MSLILKLETIPAIIISHLSKSQQRALILADNKIASNSGWDEALLKLELSELSMDVETLDLGLTGFEAGEIDLILGHEAAETGEAQGFEDLSPNRDAAAITQAGDIWQLGPHRVLCGDSLLSENWTALMGESRAQMVFTDPPYNVPIQGHVSGLGQAVHREFAQASGEMTRAQFTQFLTDALQAMSDVSTDGSLHHVCMDWRHMAELLAAGDIVYDAHKNICVWAKTNSGMGSLYRSRHEFISVFKKGKAPHINNVQLGRFG